MVASSGLIRGGIGMRKIFVDKVSTKCLNRGLLWNMRKSQVFVDNMSAIFWKCLYMRKIALTCRVSHSSEGNMRADSARCLTQKDWFRAGKSRFHDGTCAVYMLRDRLKTNIFYQLRRRMTVQYSPQERVQLI